MTTTTRQEFSPATPTAITIAWDQNAEDEYGWFSRHPVDGDDVLEVAGQGATDAELNAAVHPMYRSCVVTIER